jgi:uncharacterized membrane protein
MNFLESIIFPGIVLLLTDSLYLYSIKDMFQAQITRVQKSSITLDITSAVICYAIIIAGLSYFILQPHRPVMDAFILGCFVYGVYETTSKAILKNWEWRTVVLDTLWGGVLFAITTGVTYSVYKKSR